MVVQMNKALLILSVGVYFLLTIILVLNIKEKSKIIKNSFLVFMVTLFLSLFFVNELVMDYLFSIIIRYLYYPTFSSIILTIIITMAIFIKNVYNDKMSKYLRIINYIFASFIFVGYISFMTLKVDINSYTLLYDGNSLICLRYITRSFILWQIVRLINLYYRCFIKR